MEINVNNWFTKAGQPLTAHQSFTEQVKSIAECVKYSTSLKWENFTLYAGNNFTTYLDKHHKEIFREWNPIVKEIKAYYNNELKAYVSTALKNNNIPEVVSLTVEDIYLSFAIEQAYRKRIPGLPFAQFEPLMAILNDGHIPCGWNGPAAKNTGEHPIDYSKAKVLVW